MGLAPHFNQAMKKKHAIESTKQMRAGVRRVEPV